MWAAAICAGISNELYWELTPRELEAVLKQRADEEHREYLRFGLVAATIVNVHRRKGARLVQPGDFIRRSPSQKDFMTPEDGRQALRQFAQEQNKKHEQDSPPEGLMR